ncbi:hypothetical protein EDD11_007033 [Mortierella claussenii]|nr:hypothetical protein EDD11_007033 [Mortierella claussenii]
MENPVKEIPYVIHSLTEGGPAEQEQALETYFTSNCAFMHPYCRVPSFSDLSVPLIGVINSRWVLWMIYRWYKFLSPKIVLEVHSVGKWIERGGKPSPLRDTNCQQLQINMSTKENNPGNFANRPKDEVRDAARKGGEASRSGGFASMDAEKQANIASKGGQASSGKFEAGSERAREAGRKGGRTSGGGGTRDDDDIEGEDYTQESRTQ